MVNIVFVNAYLTQNEKSVFSRIDKNHPTFNMQNTIKLLIQLNSMVSFNDLF